MERIPLIGVCYQCHLAESWTDARTLIRPTADALRMLMPKLMGIKNSKANNVKRMMMLTRLIGENVTYKSDGRRDYWQTPTETANRRTGDCEDFAILLQAIAEYLGIPSRMVIGEVTYYTEEPPKTYGHAWVAYGKYIFDASRRDNNRAGYVANFEITSKIVREAK